MVTEKVLSSATEQVFSSNFLKGIEPIFKTWVRDVLQEKPQITQLTKEPDIWFDVDGLCEYHPDKPKKATVYGWVHNRSVPCHRGKKKLRFLKSEIDLWLKQGKMYTYAETAKEADEYLAKNRR